MITEINDIKTSEGIPLNENLIIEDYCVTIIKEINNKQISEIDVNFLIN
jgi:hypothetical protein